MNDTIDKFEIFAIIVNIAIRHLVVRK